MFESLQGVIASNQLISGGAVLGALGIWLFPPDVARPRFAVRLVPQANGVGLAGVLP